MNIFNVVKKLNKLLNKNQKRKIGLLIVIMIIGAIFEMLSVSMMVPFVNVIMSSNVDKQFVITCICILVLVYIIKNVFLYFEYYLRAKFVYENKFETKKALLHSILSKPYEYFINISSSDIIRTINSDVDQTYSLLLQCLSFFSESIVSIVLIITVFIINPEMTTILAIVLLSSVIIASKLIKPKLKQKGNEFRSCNSQMYKWLLQAINGIKEIKIARNEGFFENKYNDAGRKAIDASEEYYILSSVPRTIIEIACVCSTLIAIAIMVCNNNAPENIVPALGAFAMAAVRLMPAANRIISLSGSIAYDGPAIDNLLHSVEDVYTGNDDGATCNEHIEIKEAIELSNISYSYPDSLINVLKDISISIPIGTSIGIIGKSGIGKTTLVDVLLGLLKQTSGEIKVGGKNINVNYEEWLSHIGYIPQTIYLLDDTINNNIVFGREYDEHRIIEVLKDVQLYDFVHKLELGAETVVGERGIKLSGGQRQRIGIARALYQDPDILVFDEATSSLDLETEQAIIESINKLHGNKTMIIIAHRLETIKYCDLVIDLDKQA